MNILSPVWDYRDEYYFVQIENIEINISAYSESELTLWAYDYKEDEELIDAYYENMQDLKKSINDLIGARVIVPTLESLLEVTKGEKR